MKTSSKQRSNKQQSGFTQQCKKIAGFTLIEMIVTVTIAAILASIAIPSFTKMIERNRISTGTNEFLSALILARSEAVKRSLSISVCTSDDQKKCNSSGITNFAKGWIIFTDCNKDGVLDDSIPSGGAGTCPDIDGDGKKEAEEVIKVHGELPQLSIVSSVTGTKKITYEASGRSNSMNIVIGKDAATPKKKIIVSRTGRVKSENY